MTPVRLEPAALLSRVKHSTTEPLLSLLNMCDVKDVGYDELVALHGRCSVKLQHICLRTWYYLIKYASSSIENQREKLLD